MNKQTTISLLSVLIAGTAVASISACAEARQTSVPSVHKLTRTQKLLKAKIESDMAKADGLMLNGKFALAADLYHQALNRDLRSTEARLGLAMALGKQFKLEAADELFNDVLMLDPQNARAHGGKAMLMLYRLQSSNNNVRKNRSSILEQAAAECRQALSIDPSIPELHSIMASIYKEQGQLEEAGAEYREALRIDPRFPEAYAGLGMVHLKAGRMVDAAQSFRQAIALNPGNSSAHYGLGQVYLQKGQFDEAIKELNTSLYQFRNSAPVHLALGRAYDLQGNAVAAIRHYQEAIRIKPEQSDPYIRIADLREGRGDLEHAIAELRSGLEFMPNDPSLRLRIAQNNLRLEKLDQAIKEYRAVMAVAPGNTAAAEGLTRALYLKTQKETAGAFMASNDYESADQLISQAISMNPNSMQLRLAQAKLRSLSGQTVDLKSLGTPQNDGERLAYAEALLSQNKFAEAKEQFNQVISHVNDSKEALAVADLALMVHDLEAAENALKKAQTFSGAEERVKRGMAQLAKIRETARQDLTLANDLARKKQLSSAVDKFRSAIYADPRDADARLGLAQTLEKLRPLNADDLRQSLTQYQAFLDLAPDMPDKEREKLARKMQRMEARAYKMEQQRRKIAHAPQTSARL